MGYNVATHGQKGFNGVAILSKLPLEDVTRGLPGDEDDAQARHIEATVVGEQATLRVCGLYLPNGNPAPGPKFDYKLAWMARLRDRAQALLQSEEPVLIAGDFNVIPGDEDAARPEAWAEDALARPESRAAFRRILNLGYTDAFRARTRGPGHYTFWDYQGGAWRRDDGIRIDHVLLGPQAADLLRDCRIDREIRGREKPSDHVPYGSISTPDGYRHFPGTPRTLILTACLTNGLNRMERHGSCGSGRIARCRGAASPPSSWPPSH